MPKHMNKGKETKPRERADALERIDDARETGAVKLSLWNLDLSAVPPSALALGQLEILDLSGNQLRELLESIGKLTQLQSLNLSANRLTELPESIGMLTQLQSLDLGGNQVRELPESISKLTRLQSLNLGSNQLRELPETIGKLTQLQILWLDGNQLTELPESISELTSLERLFLHDNDDLGLPAEVLAPTWQEVGPQNPSAKPAEILEYYFRIRGNRRPLNEAKLILVGRGAAGKTSIVNRLVDDIFKAERKTEGIKITEWKLLLNGNEDVRLNVWDFGGQEIMRVAEEIPATLIYVRSM